jgi:hypothetical protein
VTAWPCRWQLQTRAWYWRFRRDRDQSVVAQVWRGGSGKQALVARLLASVEVIPVDDHLGRRAGVLLARSGTSDVVDASVICLAQDGDDILTSDPADLLDLARASGTHVELIPARSS